MIVAYRGQDLTLDFDAATIDQLAEIEERTGCRGWDFLSALRTERTSDTECSLSAPAAVVAALHWLACQQSGVDAGELDEAEFLAAFAAAVSDRVSVG